MGKHRSKRKRKHKEVSSLKYKHGTDPQYGDLDTPLAELEGAGIAEPASGLGEDSNALILPNKKDRPASQPAQAEPAAQPKLTKAQQRKLRKLQEEKQKRLQRAQVFESLEQSKLPDAHLALLRSAHSMGQKETTRQKLRRELQQQRLGMAVENGLLMRERRMAPVNERAITEGCDSESESDADLGSELAKGKGRGLQKSEGPMGDPDSDESGLDAEDDRASKHIDKARSGLPIIGMEQEVMEAVSENDVVVLCGETGCGKTTQVPQFLYEAGYGCKDFPERAGMIGVTQPRRVAAVSTATRVAAELNTPLGAVVGYQVRYDRRVDPGTSVKFMTDGILMREVQEDFLLRRYSVIVIDEAHERSLNTDILLGLLSRIVPLRRQLAQESAANPPLKLIIMSATLRIEDFLSNKRLFQTPPPLIQVAARQFPVTVHFSKRTELHNFSDAAYKKVCKIHRQLPPGGVLVFMTGQREDLDEVGPAAFGGDAAEQAGELGTGELEAEEDENAEVVSEEDLETDDEEEVVVMGGAGFTPEQIADAEEHFEASLGIDLNALKESGKPDEARGPMSVHVLPLYAMLPQAAQARVFSPCPAGHRLIVVATNVAETSLTIPGIRYVVDAGRAKQKMLEEGGGMARYEVRWISKASAEQRAGRAGRTGPGHCYRLFSSAHFNDTFPQHTPPEILNTALEGVVLAMKAMAVDKVVHFPFPTPPERAALIAAERCLVALSALAPASLALTAMGKAMARFPITPRHARMLLQVVHDAATTPQHSAAPLAYAVALAAALSAESPFVHIDSIAAEEGDGEAAKRLRQRAGAAHAQLRSSFGDAISALNALCGYESAGRSEAFCRDHFLHARNLREMAALRAQLARIVAQQLAATAGGPEAGLPSLKVDARELAKALAPPPQKLVKQLQRAIAAGWADQVARRVRSTEHVASAAEKAGGKRAVRYRTCTLEEDVFLHPNSGVHRAAPQFAVYTQLVRTEKRPYMAGLTEIEPQWLAEVAQPLCTFSDPLASPPPLYSPAEDCVFCWQSVSYGKHAWELPLARRPHPDSKARAATFAVALLDGRVLSSLAALRSVLSAPPAMAAKPEARALQRVGELLAALQSAKVDSKAALARAWQAEATFLKRELVGWLQKGRAGVLNSLWPALLAESLQAAAPVGKSGKSGSKRATRAKA
ncbi:hypothetical protein WJX72_006123 [[Myrmecia] bisecta]|uniref:RNA helicase n=1 Tax=[Myrmecia] bisecta TaxID=41462 RepID=A0AAW1Q2A1_9CHLO